MPLMRKEITGYASNVIFRYKNRNMEQNSVICSENTCVLIDANRDTVMKCSVASCDICFFPLL